MKEKRQSNAIAKTQGISNYLATSLSGIYESLRSALPTNHISYHEFERVVWPTLTSGAALVAGEYATKGMSRYWTGSDEHDYIFKFLIGTAILGCSATYRITDRCIQSTRDLSLAVASEITAIAWTYYSSFTASRLLFGPSDTSLIASLATSAFIVPGSAAYLAKRFQDYSINNLVREGAQRSDTTVNPAGRTHIANIFYQGHLFLIKLNTAQAFQFICVADNMITANKFLQKIRNIPTTLADTGYEILKKLLAQQQNIKSDRDHNTTLLTVLRFSKQDEPYFEKVERQNLRIGDLVLCDGSFDLNSAPVTGDIVAFKRDAKEQFTPQLQKTKVTTNHKPYTGEDVSTHSTTPSTPSTKFAPIDLHDVRNGRPAVLAGAKLNLFGSLDHCIRIMTTTKSGVQDTYTKTAIINNVITAYKKKTTIDAIVFSIILAGMINLDIRTLPMAALRMLLDFGQMRIPFAETFVRDRASQALLEEINRYIRENPLELISALRVTDFCRALKKGDRLGIVSDKTGTVTTPTMDVKDLWMSKHTVAEEKTLPPPSKEACSEVFASAFTDNPEELEETAILNYLKTLSRMDLKTDTIGKNYFRKMLFLNGQHKEIETMHLGLCRSLGGRLTLVKDGSHQYLVFCGIPKKDAFHKTPLLSAYKEMPMRTGVLSRDWCIARTEISTDHFDALKEYFVHDNVDAIQEYCTNHRELMNSFVHYCTFIINNPLVKGVPQFINYCHEDGIHFVMATGDNRDAAKNIADVLCPQNARVKLTFHKDNIQEFDTRIIAPHSTIIFAGLNEAILRAYEQLLNMDNIFIIFAEMEPHDKGAIALFLKQRGYVVAANGDGNNDSKMMEEAHVNWVHTQQNGSFNLGMERYCDLSSRQVQLLSGDPDKSFYESLFDVLEKFNRLMYSQQRAALGLIPKTGFKMSMVFAKTLGLPVIESPYDHYLGVAFDGKYLWDQLEAIKNYADEPDDDENLCDSPLPDRYMTLSIALAFAQALTLFALTGESTNITSMVFMLAILPLIHHGMFSAKPKSDTTYRLFKTPDEKDEKENVSWIRRFSP